LTARPLEKVPPGISPKSVMMICEPLAVLYLIDFASWAFAITLSARLMVVISSFIIFSLLLLFTYSIVISKCIEFRVCKRFAQERNPSPKNQNRPIEDSPSEHTMLFS
jgi:hypothetical protein